MKKFALRLHLPVFVFFILLLQGCIKDTVETEFRYTIYTPIYKTLEEVRSEIKLTPPSAVAYPQKIYVKEQYLFVTEASKGIHVIDNTDPSKPNNIGFINIPSNVDIAIKNNTLYADMYSDLITIDISDPKTAKLKTVVPKIFVESGWYFHDNKVLAGWDKRDTVIFSKKDAVPKGEEKWYPWNDLQYSNPTGAAGSPGAVYGTGGSLARFTTLLDRLYTVGNKNLSVFDISDDFNPSFVSRKDLGFGIETIFPYKNNLFIGTTTGVRIFSLANIDHPAELGAFAHVRRCDPVVANDKYAFATLRGGSVCGGNTSELTVLNIETLTNPVLIKSYPLENPYGLGLDGNVLFVCDGTAGLKIYNTADINNLKLVTTIKDIDPRDVILINELAIVVGKSAIYQYNYKDINNIKLLSTTHLQK